MAKQVRYFRELPPHLESKYGKEKATIILNKALQRYEELITENSDEPKAYYMHTRERIYPSIALFDALFSEGVSRKEAEEVVTGYYRWRSTGMASKIKSIFKIPGLYRIVPKFFSSIARKSFGPEAGFVSENHSVSKNEVRFDMVQCPYQMTCAKYGCPEIVKGFCDADDICYGHMHPKVIWGRTKTLGYGDGVCDFKITLKED